MHTDSSYYRNDINSNGDEICDYNMEVITFVAVAMVVVIVNKSGIHTCNGGGCNNDITVVVLVVVAVQAVIVRLVE